MNETLAKAIRADFLAWSGGVEPESEDQITVYIDYAIPRDADAEQVRLFLRRWKHEANGDGEMPTVLGMPIV